MARRGISPRQRPRPKRRGAVLWGVLLLVVAGIVGYVLLQPKTDDFDALVAEGKSALAQVVEEPDLGSRHLPPGKEIRYATPTPTSGLHSPFDVKPGFYREAQPAVRLVHSLEHGEVVIYYDQPGKAALAYLRRWGAEFQEPFQGVVIVPLKGLGPKVVLTAWRRRLDLNPFDPAAAAAFIDRYRGRGPERQVR